MRVVTAEPTRRTLTLQAAPRERHRAHVEAIALAVTTIVISFGLWLACRQQLAEVATGAALVDLNRAAEPAIAPALTVFPTAAERDFAAHAIVARVAGSGPLTHVGALTSVGAAMAGVRRDRRLATLNARLGSSSAATAEMSQKWASVRSMTMRSTGSSTSIASAKVPAEAKNTWPLTR